jgi:hypothetical protein
MAFLCRDEPEKELSFRTRKKVTFDSNVKTYERVSCDEALDFSMESESKKREEENLAKSNQSKSSSEDSSITSSSGPYQGLEVNGFFEDDDGKSRRTCSTPDFNSLIFDIFI